MKKPGNAKTPCRTCHIDGMLYNGTYYISHMNHYSYTNLPICDDLAAEINKVMENPPADNLAFIGITKRACYLSSSSIHFP